MPPQGRRHRRRQREGQHEAEWLLQLSELEVHENQKLLQLRSLLPQHPYVGRERVPHAGRQRHHREMRTRPSSQQSKWKSAWR